MNNVTKKEKLISILVRIISLIPTIFPIWLFSYFIKEKSTYIKEIIKKSMYENMMYSIYYPLLSAIFGLIIYFTSSIYITEWLVYSFLLVFTMNCISAFISIISIFLNKKYHPLLLPKTHLRRKVSDTNINTNLPHILGSITGFIGPLYLWYKERNTNSELRVEAKEATLFHLVWYQIYFGIIFVSVLVLFFIFSKSIGITSTIIYFLLLFVFYFLILFTAFFHIILMTIGFTKKNNDKIRYKFIPKILK